MRTLLFILLLSVFSLNAQSIKIEENKFNFNEQTYSVQDNSTLDDGRQWIFCYQNAVAHIFITTNKYEAVWSYSFQTLQWTKYKYNEDKNSYISVNHDGYPDVDSIAMEYYIHSLL